MKFRKKPEEVEAVQWFPGIQHAAICRPHADSWCREYQPHIHCGKWVEEPKFHNPRFMDAIAELKAGFWIVEFEGATSLIADDEMKRKYEEIQSGREG